MSTWQVAWIRQVDPSRGLPDDFGVTAAHFKAAQGEGDSLEAALWCFARSDTFEDAVLEAANLGDDADTTAAITGQIAGAFYGLKGIPARWRERVAWSKRIVGIADALRSRSTGPR